MTSITDDGQDVTESITTDRPRPRALYFYLLGALGLGVTALIGGGTLVLDSSGELMGLPIEWLDGTPFADYLVPGVILFGVLGVGSFVVVYGLLAYRKWAWYAAVALGGALVVWIIVQLFLIQLFHVLHLIYGALGVALVALSLLPSVRTYFDQ